MIEGEVSIKEDEGCKILCSFAQELTKQLLETPQEPKKTLFLKFSDKSDSRIVPVVALLRRFPGQTPVKVYFEKIGKLAYAPGRLTVSVTRELKEELQKLLGGENITVKEELKL